VTASPTLSVADGSSSSTITITLKDANDNPVSGKTVTLAQGTGSSTISAASGSSTSAGIVTFTATDTTVQTVTYTATDTTDATTVTQTAAVNFAAGPLDHIVLSPASATITAGATQAYTVQGYDAANNPLGDLTASTTFTIAPDGSCTGASCGSNTSGAHTVTGTASGKSATASLAISAGGASLSTSTITAGSTSIVANGSSTSTITVRLKDALGNNLTGSGGTVALSTTSGTLSSVTDNANGTYTATLTSGTTTGTATITGTLTGSALLSSATVTLTPGPVSLSVSTISASPTSIVANGTSTSAISVQLKDANGNNETASGGTVALATTRGTLGPATDNANGTYSATLTSATTVGTATITGTLGGSALANSAAVTFAHGTLATFRVVPASSSQTAGGAFNVTVTATDANDNTVTSYTGTVHFTSTSASATLPADYSFVAGDNGSHVFPVTLKSSGSRTVTAADGAISGTSSAIDVAPAAVSALTSTVGSSD